jgi:hypothetical protein
MTVRSADTRLWSRFFWLLLVSVAVVSCRAGKREPLQLSISLRNDTPVALDQMDIEWDGPDVPGGIMPPGNEKMAADVQPPSSKMATIRFVENESRKAHTVTVDVSRIQALQSGTHYVVLAVTSLEEAKMFINAEPWKSNR